jgi:hypothetical protein
MPGRLAVVMGYCPRSGRTACVSRPDMPDPALPENGKIAKLNNGKSTNGSCWLLPP